MSILLDDIPARRSTSPTERLRTSMAAVRVSINWFGTRKTLTAEQKSQAAESFGAEGTFLSAGKKLLDTSRALLLSAPGGRQGPKIACFEFEQIRT